MTTRCLRIAEAVDSLRIFPRIVLAAYGYWTAHVTEQIVKWYLHLPPAERTAQVTAFVTVVLPGIFGLSCWVFKVYSVGGRDWDAQNKPS